MTAKAACSPEEWTVIFGQDADTGGVRRSAGWGDDPVLVDLAVDRRPGHAQ
jgi:hypothetical protein